MTDKTPFRLLTTPIWSIPGNWPFPGIALPFDLHPRRAGVPTDERAWFSESEWEAYPWNPLPAHMDELRFNRYPHRQFRRDLGRGAADPDASPKPTWEKLLEITVYYAGRRHRIAEVSAGFREALSRITDSESLTVGGDELVIGEGIDHLTGLIHLFGTAAVAGHRLPPVSLREVGGRVKSVWSHAEIQEILDAAAARENTVETVHNDLVSELYARERQVDDTSKTMRERAEIATKLHNDIFGFEALLKKRLADHNPDSLPSDLQTLRIVLVERLESTATGAQKRIKGALSQQAIDNWAACIDMDKALTEVAKRCALGGINIERAATAGEAKSAHAAAVQAINGVSAANTPWWRVGGAVVKKSNPASAPQVSGREVRIRAFHPEGVTVPGKVSLTGSSVTGKTSGKPLKSTSRIYVPSNDADAHEIRVTLDASVTEAAVIEAAARNLCGPAGIKVELTPGQEIPPVQDA